MNRSLRLRGAAVLAAAATLVVATPGLRARHVPDGAACPPAAAPWSHFRVPHGCDGAPTDTIELQLPDGVVSAKPEYVPGWTLEVETVASEPYDEFGTTKTERVGVIRWSGGDLPDLAFYDFGVRATFLADPGTVLAFPVVQKCGDAEVAGSSRWSRVSRSLSIRPPRSPSVTPSRRRRTDVPARGDAGHLLRGEAIAPLPRAPGGPATTAAARRAAGARPRRRLRACAAGVARSARRRHPGRLAGRGDADLQRADRARDRGPAGPRRRGPGGGPGRGRPGRCRGLAAVAAPRGRLVRGDLGHRQRGRPHRAGVLGVRRGRCGCCRASRRWRR